MRNITRTVLTAALTIAALGVFSVFGADGVTKARLGSLRRDDLVVTDVSGGGGGGGVDTNAVKDIVAGYDRDIIQPREALLVPPSKWALSDITNAEGGPVSAPDIGATTPDDVSSLIRCYDETNIALRIAQLSTNTVINALGVSNVAAYASNIWKTVDSYIDYLENYATNNYKAAYLANVRATELEKWKNVSKYRPARIGPYLWEISTDYENWDAATNRFSQVYPSFRGGCSGICAGRYHGRNLDWTYDRMATVVVRIPARPGYPSILGLSSGVLSEETLTSGVWTNAYYTVPFSLSDGINENGVVIQQNVIQKAGDSSLWPVNWRTRRDGSIILFAMIRYALDRSHTAQEAAGILAQRTFIPEEFAYDIHFLVSDRTSSFVVEDGRIYEQATSRPTDVLTNFRLGTASYNDDSTVIWETVEPYGIGLERYDLIRTNAIDKATVSGMLDTLVSLWYTRAYKTSTRPFWYTEHCNQDNPLFTVMNAKTNKAVFASEVVSWAGDYVAEHTETNPRYRGGSTWQTVHTAVYDKEELTLRVLAQEDLATLHFFRLNPDVPPRPITPEEIGALPDDYTKLTNSLSFSNAVVAVSPPVVLPDKWALANVTNSGGVSADVCVVARDENYNTVSNNAMSAVQSLAPAIDYTTAVSNKLEGAVAQKRGLGDFEVYADHWSCTLPEGYFIKDAQPTIDGICFDWPVTNSSGSADAIIAAFNPDHTWSMHPHLAHAHDNVECWIDGIATTGAKLTRTAATSGLAKLNADGVLTAATAAEIRTTGDVYSKAEINGTSVTNGGSKAYADYTFRTKTDNVCHAESFTEWSVEGVYSVRSSGYDSPYAWEIYENGEKVPGQFPKGNVDSVELQWGPSEWQEGVYSPIFKRSKHPCTVGQPFVTADNVPSTNGLASLAGGVFTGEVQVASSDEGRQLRLRAHRIDVSVTNDAARVKVKNTDAETAASIVADESSAYLSLSGLDGGIDITNTGKISLSDGTEISIPRDKNGTLALYEDLLAVTNELIASSSGIIKADGSVFSFTTNATPWRLVSGWGGAKYENLLLTYKGNNTWSGQLEGGGITRFTLIYDPAGYWALYDGDDEVYTFEGGPDVTHLSMPEETSFELIRADSYKEEEGSFKPRGAVLTEQDRSSFRSRDDVVSHAFGYTDFSVTDPGTAGTIDWSTCWRSSRWGCWSVADTDGVWYNGYADYDATAVVFTNANRNVGFSASRFVSSWTNDVFVTYRGVTSAVERESRPLAAALLNKANAYVGIPRGEIVLYTQGTVPSDAVSYKMVRMQNSSTGVVFYKSPAPRYDGIRLNKSWSVGQYDLYTNDVFALALHEQPAGSGTYTGMLGSKTVVFSAPTDVRTDTNRVEKAEAIDDLFVADVARDGSNRLRVSYSNNDVRYIDNVASTLDYSRQNVAFSSAVRAAATDKQYALFIIHLNPNGGTHPFADIELKATTNNYVGESMMFYCASNVNGDETKWNADWCRLYILSSHVSLDVRQWIRIKNTDDLDDYNPRDLAVIVDPALFKRGQGTDWCTESNDELIWSYVRIHPTEGAEMDEGTGKQLWRPIMPVRWYKELPNWAKQPEYKP